MAVSISSIAAGIARAKPYWAMRALSSIFASRPSERTANIVRWIAVTSLLLLSHARRPAMRTIIATNNGHGRAVSATRGHWAINSMTIVETTSHAMARPALAARAVK